MTDVHECGLTDTQTRLLLEALDPDRVSRNRDGQSYVEGWDDRRHLIRIFGFTGWSEECLHEECIYFDAHPQRYKRGHAKAGEEIPDSVCYTAVYKYRVRLHIKCRCGKPLNAHDGTATGDGINMPQPGDAHDFAVKTAASQALKRAAINYGDQFGLSLYNDGSTDAVVIGTAFTMEANALARANSNVIGGELDEKPDDGPAPEPENQDPARDLVAEAGEKAVRWVEATRQAIKDATSVEDLRGRMWQEVVAAQNNHTITREQAGELGKAMTARATELEEFQQLTETGVAR